MNRVASYIDSQLAAAARSYGIRPAFTKAIVIFPFIVVFLCGIFGAIPTTRSATSWIIRGENHPVELLTFAILLVGGMRGLALARQARQNGAGGLVVGLYAVFSVGLLFTAMEEVAWGQWLVGFQTPSVFKEINAQGELTLHNIRGVHGHTEFFRVAFGLGGLIGVWLSFRRTFRKIGAPVILLPWFLIIIVLAGLDLYVDYYEIQTLIDKGVNKLAELVEMLIAASGFLFIWLNARMLAAGWKETMRLGEIGRTG